LFCVFFNLTVDLNIEELIEYTNAKLN